MVTHVKSKHVSCRLLAAGLAAILYLILAAGCTTTENSDMPWNSPQPWEGSPGLPGLPSGE